jgi:Holliday junction resolvase
MTNYTSGARLERLWIVQMKRRGYNAARSAGSKGMIDCIAWNDEFIILAQIKNGRAAYTQKDVERLKAMPRPSGVIVLLVERVGSGGVEWKEIRC